jgi:hypothetical protein
VRSATAAESFSPGTACLFTRACWWWRSGAVSGTWVVAPGHLPGRGERRVTIKASDDGTARPQKQTGQAGRTRVLPLSRVRDWLRPGHGRPGVARPGVHSLRECPTIIRSYGRVKRDRAPTITPPDEASIEARTAQAHSGRSSSDRSSRSPTPLRDLDSRRIAIRAVAFRGSEGGACQPSGARGNAFTERRGQLTVAYAGRGGELRSSPFTQSALTCVRSGHRRRSAALSR